MSTNLITTVVFAQQRSHIERSEKRNIVQLILKIISYNVISQPDYLYITNVKRVFRVYRQIFGGVMVST